MPWADDRGVAADWLATGRFGAISLGGSRDDVAAAVGPPEVVGGASRRHRLPAIWKYGDVELHFDQTGGRLALIHLDAFDVPSGGHAIALDVAPLRGGQRRDVIERWLDLVGIAHRLEPAVDEDTVRLATAAGVVLPFTERASPCSFPPGLFALSQSVPQTS